MKLIKGLGAQFGIGGGAGKARRQSMIEAAKAQQDQQVALSRQQQESQAATGQTEQQLSRAKRTPRGRRQLLGDSSSRLG